MNLIEILFPKRCPGCDGILIMEDRNMGFCKECIKKIQRPKDIVCIKCGKPINDKADAFCKDCKNISHDFVQSKGVFVYSGIVKEAMYRFKYKNRREYAEVFAKEAYILYERWIKANRIDVIIPVPMYRSKKRKRGYNQAEAFAKELSKLTHIAFDRNVIFRIKDTPALKSLNPSQRKKNLKKAFIFSKNVVQYENVLVVDDIYTTGATMDEVSKVLKKGGISNIYGLYTCIGRGDS